MVCCFGSLTKPTNEYSSDGAPTERRPYRVLTTDSMEPTASPSAEALGYSLSVAFADEDKLIETEPGDAMRFVIAAGRRHQASCFV